MRDVLAVLVMAVVLTGCSNTVHPGKRTVVSYTDFNGKQKIAITATVQQASHTMMLQVENIGEQEYYIEADMVYFKDSSGKIIGSLGSEGRFMTTRGMVIGTPIGIGRIGLVAFSLPEETASISYRAEGKEYFEVAVE